MADTEFSTPEQAESAFYEAFERSDVEAMMQVWDTSAAVACIHPMGTLLHGVQAVRQGWLQIFSSPQRMHFELSSRQQNQDHTLAVHTVIEHIYLNGERQPRPPIIATNMYRKTDQGWRMVLHHASPSVVDPANPKKTTTDQRLH